MRNLSQLGRALYTFAIWGLAIQAFICSKVIFELEPVPAWIPHQIALANLTGFVLVAIGIGLLLERLTYLASLVLTGVLLFWVIVLHLHQVLIPGPELSFTFETLALAGVAWTLAATSRANTTPQPHRGISIVKLAPLGWYAYGISLCAFCVVNFLYHDSIARMIPTWIPAHLFWAYFTGVASLAAGISIITGVWARIGLIMAGTMYGSWVMLIHIPYLSTHPSSRGMWTDMFITLALSGGAWFLSGTLSKDVSFSRWFSERFARLRKPRYSNQPSN